MGDVQLAWQRLVDWLETNAPTTASSILAPATPAAITAAEERMCVVFPVELRTWLQASGADNDSEGATEGIVPGNRDLLGLAAMERTYHFKMEIERDDPSDDPEFPSGMSSGFRSSRTTMLVTASSWMCAAVRSVHSAMGMRHPLEFTHHY
ncbi:hypothetical protein [Streptomyces sp. NPDC048669]|uniref:hypothetical protein n=1 Tax=Streptomyces sp. NPDC048669 TaxID=3155267 RepID=UPI003424F482